VRLAFSERYVVALNFLLIAGCAYFAARALNDAVAQRLIVIPPAPQARVSSRSGDLPRTAYDLIVQRDIFNAVKQQAAPPPPPPPPAATAADLHLKLLGTAQSNWTRPFALFEDQNTHDQNFYQLHDQIPDAGELTAVEKTKVVIDHNGTPVTLEIPTDQTNTGSAPAPAPAPIMAAMPSRFSRDVNRVGPNDYTIPRTAVERNLQNMGQLFTQMRAIPNVQDGKTDGFRLSEVQAGSLFSQMGLRNGDVVTSIGGQALNDPTQAIALLNQLRTASQISLTVLRHGRPVDLNYQIE
jgi:general secretion pathway protein C